MGAETFYDTVEAATPKEAFAKAVADAQWESGHGGYTGTIAEKGSFVDLTHIVQGYSAERRLELALAAAGYYAEDNDPRIPAADRAILGALHEQVDDKWGPAGAIEIRPRVWAFFGWASS